MSEADALPGRTGPLVVFYNVSQTTTHDIASMVRRACGQDYFINLDVHAEYQQRRPFNRDFFRTLTAAEPTIKGVSANRIVPDLHLAPDLDVFPIVFLRHPLLHALATYEASRSRKNDWPGKELIMRLDLAQWIDWCLEPEQRSACRNFQSCLLSLDNEGRIPGPRGPHGILDKPGFHGRFESLDAAAKTRLTSRRGRLLLVEERLDAAPVVGIAELMDKSLFLLDREAKRKGLAFARARDKAKDAGRDWRRQLHDAERSLPSDTLNRFYDANEDDLLLWERYFSKMTWVEPVSYHPGKLPGRAASASAEGTQKAPRPKKVPPAEPIPGLEEQLYGDEGLRICKLL